MSTKFGIDFYDDIGKYREWFNRLKNENNFSRLGKTFSTRNKRYILDTGTGKIFEINENIYRVLKCLFETDNFEELFSLNLSKKELELALNEINEAVISENILQAPQVRSMVGPQTESLELILDEAISQVTLELTERCNLRCGYCIYNESNIGNRNFGQQDMSFETARKAIDYVAKHADQKLAIGFYGGEPLLRYELIQQCVAHAQETIKDINLNFGMTTNLVLMTKEKAQYFANIGNFVITVSLDGPQDVHDEFRKFPDGTGSFSIAIQGLKNLVEAYKDRASTHIIINVVTEGPNYMEKYTKINGFFSNTEWLPKDIVISNSYVSHALEGSAYTGIYSETDQEIAAVAEKDFNPLMVWSMNHRSNKEQHLFSSVYVQNELIQVHKRPLHEKPLQYYKFNGCCVPGGRRVYVTAHGDYLPCEKVGTTPPIGNVDKGLDIDAIKKHYVKDFMDEAVKYCNDCWAVNMCSNCYVNCYDENGVNFSYRHNSCRYTRYSLEKNLIWYHEILEHDPESLKYLNDVVLT